MADINYPQMWKDLLRRYAHLMAERNRCDVELSRLNQILRATANMLTDDDRRKAEVILEKMEAPVGLKEGILMVFRANPDAWLLPSQVRDQMLQMGFDFSEYVANPLASIGTTMKRMAGQELATKFDEGKIFYKKLGFEPRYGFPDPLNQRGKK